MGHVTTIHVVLPRTFLRRFAGRLGDESSRSAGAVVTPLRGSRRALEARLAEGGIVQRRVEMGGIEKEDACTNGPGTG